MTEDYPVPPPALVRQWMEAAGEYLPDEWYYEMNIATQAARWGADTELEAVCDEILHCAAGIYEDKVSDWSELVDLLRDSRRPKPPSLKERALKALEQIRFYVPGEGANADTIRRALEQLDD